MATVCVDQLVAQQNYNYENFGNQSILLNGNVTGSVSDLGATYYNPARLVTLSTPVLAINAKVYQLQTVKLNNLLGLNNELKDNNFGSIPRMLSGVFSIKGMEKDIFAYSALTKSNNDFSFAYETGEIDEFTNGEFESGKIGLDNKTDEEWYGASWARSLTDKWAVGASVFFSTYKKTESSTARYIYVGDDDLLGVYQREVLLEQTSSGFFSKIGICYVDESIELGLNIDLPYFQIKGKGRIAEEKLVSGNTETSGLFTSMDLQDLKAKRKRPIGFQFGAGIPLKNGRIHTKISWNKRLKPYTLIQTPDLLRNGSFTEEFRSVFNYGIGYQHNFSDIFSAYGSFSTDFSPFDSSASLFDLIDEEQRRTSFNTDYYHFGLGTRTSIASIGFTIGAIYSHGKSNFNSPLDLNLENNTGNAELILTRWRFLLGLDIKLFSKKTEKNI
ncbi:hypothetical protein [Flagellimonas sp. GZD32]|uniref:hypothetical protein n=1 Tax=Flagellimonas cixiensis TaxID=3228750 RepID=UPI0035C88025